MHDHDETGRVQTARRTPGSDFPAAQPGSHPGRAAGEQLARGAPRNGGSHAGWHMAAAADDLGRWNLMSADGRAITSALLAVAAAIEDRGNDAAAIAERITQVDGAICDAADVILAALDPPVARRGWLHQTVRRLRRGGRRVLPPLASPDIAAAGSADVPCRCDNRSVGVIAEDGYGNFLLFERATPAGIAPAAGHVDNHGGWEETARAEVAEELGLTVVSLEHVTGGWRPNACHREPGPRGPGHDWRVYRATVAGDLHPCPREARNVRWLNHRDVRELADRTAGYAAGRLTTADFAARPGIEPVWIQWLADAGIIDAARYDLPSIGQLAEARPRQSAAW
jgi:8-oxo-dGTP pyrophosphatase MutT (NUDIX family)